MMHLLELHLTKSKNRCILQSSSFHDTTNLVKAEQLELPTNIDSKLKHSESTLFTSVSHMRSPWAQLVHIMVKTDCFSAAKGHCRMFSSLLNNTTVFLVTV